MTNERIATLAVEANAIEREVRTAASGAEEQDDQAMATAVLRQTIALRKALEAWIVSRATRAQR